MHVKAKEYLVLYKGEYKPPPLRDPLQIKPLYTQLIFRNLCLWIYYLVMPCRIKCQSTKIAVYIWNSVDDSIVACDLVNSFKNRVDKFLNFRGLI